MPIFIGRGAGHRMATPARNLGFYLLWFAMLAVLSIVWPRGTDHSSPFAGMGPGIERAILIGCAVLILFKVSAAALWRLARAPQTAEAEAQPGKPTDPGLALAAATGVFAAPWSMFVLAVLLSDRSSALVAHGVPFLFAVAALALLAACCRALHAPMRAFSGALAVSAIISLLVATWFVAPRITSVLDSAEAIANGAPYCIQIATAGSGFRPAVARLDLSPLTMRARCVDGWCWQNHAILAVDSQGERKLLNWSHRHGEFRNDVLNATIKPPAIVCQPAQGFARKLPIFRAAQAR